VESAKQDFHLLSNLVGWEPSDRRAMILFPGLDSGPNLATAAEHIFLVSAKMMSKSQIPALKASNAGICIL
jgi:hypothetical protein